MKYTTQPSRAWIAMLAAPLLMALGASAVHADDGDDDDRHGGKKRVLQSGDIFSFADGSVVRGGGTLLRSRQAVRARLSTMQLDPGAGYSVWWVVFNRPARCSGGICDDDDLFVGGDPNQGLNLEQIERVNISVFYADGFVTGSDGVANVVAELHAGSLPRMTDVLFGNGLAKGRGFGAEIHLVIRTHGAAVAGEVDVQTSTFEGYCDVNTCADQQFIVFPPAH